MEIVTLRPFSQGELAGRRETFVDRLLTGKRPPDPSSASGRASHAERIHKGGYPEAVRRIAPRRRAWFASYLTTILQRDIRDLSNIHGLTESPRLLAILASRSSSLLNLAEVSREAGIPYTTLQRYMALFETTFLIHTVPAWSANIGKRFVKAPKLMAADTGFMAYLLNVSADDVLDHATLSGRFAETFVGCELAKQIEWSENRPSLLHYRTGSGAEVDFVLEAGGRRLAGVEVKLSRSVGPGDFRGLRSLAEDAAPRFVGGIVLYAGNRVASFGDRLWAVPLDGLWAD
jgi:predicted AAA+ superfamily ATPase